MRLEVAVGEESVDRLEVIGKADVRTKGVGGLSHGGERHFGNLHQEGDDFCEVRGRQDFGSLSRRLEAGRSAFGGLRRSIKSFSRSVARPLCGYPRGREAVA